MNKKLVIVIIAVLVAAVGILGFLTRNGNEEKEGLTIQSAGSEITAAWDDIERESFEGDLVNGKGEVSHGEYEGIELSKLLAANGVELSADTVVTATSEDNYSAELTGAEVLENGKVFVALSQDGKMIEGIEGGQGAQLIVFGDQNSKRAVRYLKTFTLD